MPDELPARLRRPERSAEEHHETDAVRRPEALRQRLGKVHQLALAMGDMQQQIAFTFLRDIELDAQSAVTDVTLPTPWRTDFATLTVFVPPGASSFSFPELPADLAEYAPTESTEYCAAALQSFEPSAIGDYADFRQHHALRRSSYRMPFTYENLAVAATRKQNP